MVLEWLCSHRAVVSRAVLHYDCEYGMHVATGQLCNLPLAGKIKDILATLPMLTQWRWIRGHSFHGQ